MHVVHYYIDQQTGQGPKVKSPPPVPPKPKRNQSQPAIKPQTAPAAPQPKQLDLLSQQPQNPSSLEQPQDPSSLEQPQDPSSLEQPQDPSSLEQPQDSSSSEQPQDPSTSKQPQNPSSSEQPQDPSSLEQPQDPSSEEQPQDPSSEDQPQDPSPLEYITLREMLAVLVDLLAGNAPVIIQLNNHLFSPGLIPKAVYIDAQNSLLSPFDRANKMMNAVLATFEYHPNPNSAFTSFITALHNVGLTIIATKLSDALSKRI